MSVFDEMTCKTCANFHRDYTTRAGGWCPVPKNRARTPVDPEGKYVCQSRKACKQYKKRAVSAATIKQEANLQELFRLIRENPALPIVPMVDEEIVTDDCCSWWMGSWGSAEATKYYIGEERVHFYEPDDWGDIEQALNDCPDIKEYIDLADDDMDDEAVKKQYEDLPWIEAIVVYITLPER